MSDWEPVVEMRRYGGGWSWRVPLPPTSNTAGQLAPIGMEWSGWAWTRGGAIRAARRAMKEERQMREPWERVAL